MMKEFNNKVKLVKVRVHHWAFIHVNKHLINCAPPTSKGVNREARCEENLYC